MHVLTQAMMDCLVSPPQPGDESHDTFIKVSVRVQFREYLMFQEFHLCYVITNYQTPACIHVKSQVGVHGFRMINCICSNY